jgi:hypothetical protein
MLASRWNIELLLTGLDWPSPNYIRVMPTHLRPLEYWTNSMNSSLQHITLIGRLWSSIWKQTASLIFCPSVQDRIGWHHTGFNQISCN